MKKYVPSGYQIITVDGTNYVEPSSKIETPTEDEKVLIDILKSGEIKKPILLTIKNIANSGDDISGIASLCFGETLRGLRLYGGDTYFVDITYNTETEETTVSVHEN